MSIGSKRYLTNKSGNPRLFSKISMSNFVNIRQLRKDFISVIFILLYKPKTVYFWTRSRKTIFKSWRTRSFSYWKGNGHFRSQMISTKIRFYGKYRPLSHLWNIGHFRTWAVSAVFGHRLCKVFANFCSRISLPC